MVILAFAHGNCKSDAERNGLSSGNACTKSGSGRFTTAQCDKSMRKARVMIPISMNAMLDCRLGKDGRCDERCKTVGILSQPMYIHRYDCHNGHTLRAPSLSLISNPTHRSATATEISIINEQLHIRGLVKVGANFFWMSKSISIGTAYTMNKFHVRAMQSNFIDLLLEAHYLKPS